MAGRIREAASIGNVAELEALALELSAGEPPAAALGARIGRLAAGFDFPALLDLAGRLTAGPDPRARRADRNA
jgi:hypothetical protein